MTTSLPCDRSAVATAAPMPRDPPVTTATRPASCEEASIGASTRISRVSIVAVLGAGTLGGSIAHKIAARGRFHEVRIIDPAQGIAGGKALDIQQSAAIERFGTQVTAHGELDAAAGADAAVLADSASGANAAQRADDDGQALEMLRRLYRFNRRAVIICAGVSHRRVVERAVTELDIPRRQVIGAAPAALQSALRAIVAVELRCPPGDVSLAVLGRPPEHLVIPWSEATVRGFALSRLLDAPALARLQAQARLVWPPGPYTLASATARLCETAIGHAGQKGLTCYTVLDGELGTRGCAAAVTVELDAGGVTRIVEPSLGGQERVQLETALARP